VAGRKLALALVTGFTALGLGANIVLLPVFLPARAFWIWPLCYWGGGGMAVLGGFVIDLAFIATVARLIRMRRKRYPAL